MKISVTSQQWITYFILKLKTYRPELIGRIILIPGDQREHVSSQGGICLLSPALTSWVCFSRDPVNKGGWVALEPPLLPNSSAHRRACFSAQMWLPGVTWTANFWYKLETLSWNILSFVLFLLVFFGVLLVIFFSFYFPFTGYTLLQLLLFFQCLSYWC